MDNFGDIQANTSNLRRAILLQGYRQEYVYDTPGAFTLGFRTGFATV